MPSEPLAYLLTWTCHGTWLHGDARGSVASRHNGYGTPVLEPDRWLEEFERRVLSHPVEKLGVAEREAVLEQMQETCTHRRWRLHPAYVGSNHVHVVVSAPVDPDRVAQTLKAWSTRRLSERAGGPLKPWSEGASTEYMWSQPKVDEKIDYVLRLQTGDARARREERAHVNSQSPKR
ncbi:MAG: transposase [Phycisphaerales bacterium]|nr:transposase [Phycisphaerales bacterium]